MAGTIGIVRRKAGDIFRLLNKIYLVTRARGDVFIVKVEGYACRVRLELRRRKIGEMSGVWAGTILKYIHGGGCSL